MQAQAPGRLGTQKLPLNRRLVDGPIFPCINTPEVRHPGLNGGSVA